MRMPIVHLLVGIVSLGPCLAGSPTSQLDTYGLKQYAPGVIGAPLTHVKNTTVLDRAPVRRLNARLRSKLRAQLNKAIDRASQLTSLHTRELHDTDSDEINANNHEQHSEVPSDSEYYAMERYSATIPSTELDDGNEPKSAAYAETIFNRLTYYLMNVTMGSPPQQFMVQVDTGSSDLWVPSKLIQYNGFDTKRSDTYRDLDESFNIKYIKDAAQGHWGVDVFGFGGSSVQVPELQFAIATSAPDATMGILGIGPIESETSREVYPNLPIMLVRDNLISRAVYSMYMGGIDDTSGTILFGGSDKAKYKQLTILPLVSKSTLSVELDIIALTSNEGPHHDNELLYSYERSGAGSTEQLTLQEHDQIVTQQPITVLLDSGTSLTYLPADVIKSVANAFKATYDQGVGMYVVHEQDMVNNPLQGLNFQFENQLIYMPKSELFWPLSWFSLEPSPYYAMTMMASDSAMGYNILGDSFLRNAYVIYDLDEKEVHIGQYFPSPFNHIVPF